MVGRVIGKGGETIKLLQKQYGANIQIDQQTDPMKVSVAGQPQAVEGALAAVVEIINGGNPPFLPGGGASPYGKDLLVCNVQLLICASFALCHPRLSMLFAGARALLTGCSSHCSSSRNRPSINLRFSHQLS